MIMDAYTFDKTNSIEILTAGDHDVHTMANIVPLDPETATLEESIKMTGLLHPIMLYKGKIIDGRRRAIACKRIGVVPRVNDIGVEKDFSEEELYGIVLAENTRRSINKGQKAIIAAFQTEIKAHIKIGIKRAPEYAKKIWDVSPVTYDRAKFIVNNSRMYAIEIFNTGFAQIEGKQMSMSKTWEYLKKSKHEQTIASRIPGEQGIAVVYDMLKPMTASLLQVADSESVIKALTMMQNDIRESK